MSGQQPLERQWIVLRTLSARRFGATVRELAEELEVSQKTIRRDLILLRDLGFPVSPREGAHGRNHWIATSDAGTPPLSFDVSEILALYLGRTLLEPLAGTLIWDAAQSAFRKIKASLGDAAVKYLAGLGGHVHRTSFRDSVYEDKSQLIDALMVAIEDQRMTFITYRSAKSTEPLTYDVYPYGLIFHRGSLYLVAHSQQHSEVRTFKVDRISDVSLETLKFQKPADFDLREFLRHSLGVFHSEGSPQRVVIRFAPEAAQYIQEHRWQENQTISRQRDGSVILEMQLSRLEEVKAWVLSFGARAIVEEPEELREMIAQDVRSLAEEYATGRMGGEVTNVARS
jgi:proteasome accessory factor B